MAEDSGRATGGITRRQFLAGTAAAVGWAAVSPGRRIVGLPIEAAAEESPAMPRSRLSGERFPRDPQPIVVHVHSCRATSWDYATGWYGDFVSQDEVNSMVDQGVMALTGTTSRAAAWQALIPDYVPGQRVAIKVNLNNARSTDDADNAIDALIEPVNSVIAALKEIGVAEPDIWVYDASRWIPDRFQNGCEFAGVQFSGRNVNTLGFSDTEQVTFEPPPGGPSLAGQRISQVLASADYLINMPIMKKHGHAYVTLSFKNHFGSVEQCSALHGFAFPYLGSYTPAYNPLVDIYRNPHFVGKTVLTIGDGLYGSRVDHASQPGPWATFQGQSPNSLFFSTDPVAIDCVMYDFLEAESGVPSTGDDYLALAAQAGLGVFEHRAPGASSHEDWYRLIAYTYLDLDGPPLLSAPPDEAIVCAGSPLFEWTPLPAATSYQLQVDDDEDCLSPAIDATTVDAAYVPDAVLPVGTYFWRVKSQGPCGDSDWSAKWRFTVADTITAPILSSPPDAGSTCAATPTFNWEPVPAATSYRIQMDDNEDLSSPIIDATISEAEFTPDTLLSPGTYFWQVKALAPCGDSDWSTKWQIHVVESLATPALVTPANGTTSCDARPRFEWAAVSGATSYQLQVAADAGFSSPAIDITADDCACRPDVALPPGVFFWRVRATSDCGAGEWSGAWSFEHSRCAYLPMTMHSR